MHIHTHNNGTASLTLTENPNIKHKTQKQPKPNIVNKCHHNCAYVRLMAFLIIFPVIFQTVINLIMLSIAGWGEGGYKMINQINQNWPM